MSADAPEMVTIPRAELDALRAEVRRLRQAEGDEIARARILTDAGPGPDDQAPRLNREQLARAWGIGA